MNLLELFCAVDDFWQKFEPQWRQQRLESGEQQRQRSGVLCESEMMTIVIHFHQARYRDFKTYYTQHVQMFLRSEFPQLVSYERFIQCLPSILEPLCAFLQTCLGSCTGIAFIDFPALAMCLLYLWLIALAEYVVTHRLTDEIDCTDRRDLSPFRLQ
jgi:hypothetical protein